MPFITKNKEPTYEFALKTVTVWLEQNKLKNKHKATAQANQSAWDYADKQANDSPQGGGWATPAETQMEAR